MKSYAKECVQNLPPPPFFPLVTTEERHDAAAKPGGQAEAEPRSGVHERPPPSSLLYTLGHWAAGAGSCVHHHRRATSGFVERKRGAWSAGVEQGAEGGGGDSKTPLEKCAYRVRISHGAEIRTVVCATVSSVEENNFRTDRFDKLTVSCLRRCGFKLYLGKL